VVIGEGGSGGALALAVADRMLIRNGRSLVIAPVGAAAILYHDPAGAGAGGVAADHRRDLEGFGMIDGIVREPDDGAATNPELAIELVERAIVANLDELRRYDARQLIRHRYGRILTSVTSTSPSRRGRDGWELGPAQGRGSGEHPA